MAETSIEWTDKVWNPVSGCAKVSQGCKNCYAEAIANRFWGERKFTDVRCHEDRLDAPLHWRKPCRIFVNSMSDLFHEKVPFEFIDKVFAVMALCPQHTFQVLTKRPERMREYCDKRCGIIADTIIAIRRARGDNGCVCPLPHLDPGSIWYPLANLWLGVSVEDQKTADERIPLLLQTPAAVRWVSYEPALGPVDFTDLPVPEKDPFRFDSLNRADDEHFYNVHAALDWVVVGGESGPNARPMNPDWARSVRDQCVAAGVPFFFKQWGEWLPVNARHDLMHRVGKKAAGRLLDGREWNEYPSVDLA